MVRNVSCGVCRMLASGTATWSSQPLPVASRHPSQHLVLQILGHRDPDCSPLCRTGHIHFQKPARLCAKSTLQLPI